MDDDVSKERLSLPTQEIVPEIHILNEYAIGYIRY